jgi:hypothetical protein
MQKINHFIYQYVPILTHSKCHTVSIRKPIYVTGQVSAYIKVSGVQLQELSHNYVASISFGDL